MPIAKKEDWKKWVDNNQDGYGNACIKVAARVMELLDKVEEFEADDLIMQADKELNEGITGFMAGAVAQMVSHCHSRGEEFRKKWNLEMQIGSEGERANERGTVINPALLEIG